MQKLGASRLAFVGGGTMAEAIARGVIDQDLIAPDHIIASDPLEARRTHLAEELGICTTADNSEAVREADIVVLAIKPQVVKDALPALDGHLRDGALIISIIAGVRIATIQDLCGARAIVRVMPNTPAQIGEGMSVWLATAEVSPVQQDWACSILEALGEQVRVQDEGQIDMATAISGSGPAYVFLFIEALIDAGVQIGLSRPIAERLVLQTVRGSALFAQGSGEHPAVLRNMVTSPAGTTAEGLLALERGGLRAIVMEAALAAYRKAELLGGTHK